MSANTERQLAALMLAFAMMGPSMAAPAALDVGPFFAEVDANHDGCISEAEWFAAKLPKSAWTILKDSKSCVTVQRMHEVAPPPGIDLNGDGKLTAEEFREFDRRGAPGASSPVSKGRRGTN